MNKFAENHPDPEARLWTIRVNTEVDQDVAQYKEVYIGQKTRGYVLYNRNGDVIAIQVENEPIIEAPENEEKVQAGFKRGFKMPQGMGLFPQYETLVKLLTQ